MSVEWISDDVRTLRRELDALRRDHEREASRQRMDSLMRKAWTFTGVLFAIAAAGWIYIALRAACGCG